MISNILRRTPLKTFIIPGDNDWNDCPYPDEAMRYWMKYFNRFDKNWNTKFFPGVNRHWIVTQNWSFKLRHCLFVGLNLVGGDVNDKDEWNLRLQENIGFVQYRLRLVSWYINTVVIFGHTALRENVSIFFDGLVETARLYPHISFLYVHGDGHYWISDFPWKDAPNLGRVQLDKGALAPPVLISVKSTGGWPFEFNRRL
uniref:Calcineurin-like phosphoesterase domain-containing protein n=1 Tax=Corethron hystrix TaxID=216773 RepID=A0A7S1BRZ3_9STRA|mmetsp:Transcript_38928/g.90572  ORF Transcript_38928/g.90572 Transcript_38928/m.90572 type:complete len:200 (+) Transcript_38928:2-601(+)